MYSGEVEFRTKKCGSSWKLTHKKGSLEKNLNREYPLLGEKYVKICTYVICI